MAGVSHKIVSKAQYLTVTWVLCGFAIAFFLSRILIRLKVYRRLMIDDGLVTLALICLLAADIMNTIEVEKTYTVQAVIVDHIKKPANYAKITDAYAKYQWANAYLYFTGLWAVKGSFLAFYHGLTQRLTYYRLAWWVTVVYTALTFIGSLLAYGFLDGSHYKSNTKNEAIKYNFSVDLTTDIFITLIPLSLALRSRIPTKQKLALSAVFSLSLINCIFAIVRFSLNTPTRGIAPPSWLNTWSTVEQSVSVMVACLASFRTLVISSQASKHSGNSSSRRRNENAKNNSIVRKMRFPSDGLGFSHKRSQGGSSTMQWSQGSGDMELLESAHVKEPTAQSMSPKVEEVRGSAVTPMSLQGSDPVWPLKAEPV